MTVTKRRTALRDSFDTTKTSLEGVIKDLESGRLKLPNFQRSWKWPDKNIVSLIETIAEGHPLGSLMFLETGGDLRFDHRCIEGAGKQAEDNGTPTQLIMDGQQRLTSMYQALFAKSPVKIGQDRSVKYRRYFFDMRTAVDGARPVIESIISLPVDEKGRLLKKDSPDYTKEEVQYETMTFPINMTFRFREWEKGFQDYWNDAERSGGRYEALGTAGDFRAAIVDSFSSYMLPLIILRRTMTVDGVCLVYEKLNSKGVPLDAFDLLIAQFAARNFNLREDWFGVPDDESREGRKAYIRKACKGLLEGLTPKLFLQCVSMLNDLKHGKTTLEWAKFKLLELTVDQYQQSCDTATEGYIKAYRFMTRQSIYSPSDLPPLALVTALATIFGHLGRRAEDFLVQDKLRQWFWSVIFSGSYTQGSDATAATDIMEVVRWLIGDGKEPSTVSKAVVLDKRIVQATKKSSPTLHSALGTRILNKGAKDFSTGGAISEHVYMDDGYDMHHVFPVKWCRDNGIPAELYDSVVNKTPMSVTTNRRIGGQSPRDYIAKLENDNGIKADQMDAIIRSHGINPDRLRNNDFDAFFAERSEYLFGLIERDMNKKVARATAADQPIEAPDDEEWPIDAEYRMVSRGAVAYAKVVDSKLIILSGSILSRDENPSLFDNHREMRQRITTAGVAELLDDGRYRLTEDWVFPSASNAASVISGNVSGIGVWRTVRGAQMTAAVAASIR